MTKIGLFTCALFVAALLGSNTASACQITPNAYGGNHYHNCGNVPHGAMLAPNPYPQPQPQMQQRRGNNNHYRGNSHAGNWSYGPRYPFQPAVSNRNNCKRWDAYRGFYYVC